MALKDFIPGFKKKAAINLLLLQEPTREQSRGAIDKAYIPRFLYKPPFGYPRFYNVPYVRWLAQTPYVEMCIFTIINEICSIKWDIVVDEDLSEEERKQYVDESGELKQEVKDQIAQVKLFFRNPNTNDETFEEVFVRRPIRDMLEVNSGVLVKEYNLKEELVEVVTRDGGTFTKNPDIYGKYTNRDDIIIPGSIEDTMQGSNVSKPSIPFIGAPDGQRDDSLYPFNIFHGITSEDARRQAAYFQYGGVISQSPVPFGRREIIWLEENIRTDVHYSPSPVQILADTIQMLVYSIESDLEYFNDNNVPKGIIGLENADADELKSFKQQWFELQMKKDDFGNFKRMMNKVPLVSKIPKFERIEFSSTEMQIIEKQKWYAKMVWSCFGVTPTELGYTEDAKGAANQIVQSKVFKKKAINPKLRLLEQKYSKRIITEDFEYPHLKFKFLTFDIDDETQKWDLYDKQIKSGIKTVNEIRREEGMEEKEGGDELRKGSYSFEGQGDNPLFGGQRNPNQNPKVEKTEDREEEATNPKEEKKSREIEGKDLSKEEKKKLDEVIDYLEKKLKKLKKKALGPGLNLDNPLLLKEGETMTGYNSLNKALKFLLGNIEKKLKEKVENEITAKPIDQIKAKSINDIIKSIVNDVLNLDPIFTLVNEVIKSNFIKGWDQTESLLSVNIQPGNSMEAIKFLNDHTFDNIKGMETDLKNKLRQVIERGVVNNDSRAKLAKEIKNTFNLTEGRAETIARTETSRAANQGKLQAMNNSGEKAKKYLVITYDDRTSEVSKAMGRKYGTEEKAIPLDKNFEVTVGGKVYSGQVPPFMPNDRDTVVFLLE